MPKAPSSTKAKKPSAKSGFKPLDPKTARQTSLAQELREDQLRAKYGVVTGPEKRNKGKHKAQDGEGGDDGDDEPSGRITGVQRHGSNDARRNFVDPKLSRNILRLAQEQQEELELEEEAARTGVDPRLKARQAEGSRGRSGFTGEMADDVSDEDDEDGMSGAGDDGELNEQEAMSGDEDLEEEYEELEIDPEDRRLMEEMDAARDQQRVAIGGEHADLEEALPGFGGGSRNLADIIMAKLEASEANEQAGGLPRAPGAPQERAMPPGINPKVIEVYSKVGELLSRYKSGPLPKALKIVPSLPAWETILYITNPATWTPHATLAATRIFVSNLKAHQTQKFFELILLDKVRDEIAEKGKLSVQLYDALKKGLYKPAAFFKGLLFPLCESGAVTLKEAAIISSVLSKVSVPVLHSAAALLHLASMPYKGPTSLFIRVLLDKKYALPYKVVDALVFHFLQFADPDKGVEMEKIGGVSTGNKRMPVLWHQSLLVFAQRYKQDLTPDQKTALLDLLRVQKHDGIGPEVRRELLTGQARGEMLEEPLGAGDMSDDGDDAMSV